MSLVPALRATSKGQALRELAERASAVTRQPEWSIFKLLLKRERFGTTGAGNGIAIPHGRLPDLDCFYGLLARLEKPVDFDAVDGRPVDFIVLLLAPEAARPDYLKALARVSQLLWGTVSRGRRCRTDALCAALTGRTAERVRL